MFLYVVIYSKSNVYNLELEKPKTVVYSFLRYQGGKHRQMYIKVSVKLVTLCQECFDVHALFTVYMCIEIRPAQNHK